MKQIMNSVFDEEQALYGIHNAEIINCEFSGIADGESALKECSDIKVNSCTFKLRYPLWHATNAAISGCRMTETCRAALWYDKHMSLKNCGINGIKALRESNEINMEDCHIRSLEFAWKCGGLTIRDCTLVSEYPFYMDHDLDIDKLDMSAKYAFQYVENTVIRNSELDTKDAFWHCKNVTVYDSVIKGEYLAWYSEGLHLIRCKIIGTQPLCYAKDLILEDCEMIDCDLAFEYSDVRADIIGTVKSVKNPVSGYIRADAIGEVIIDKNQRLNSDCDIICRQNSV